MTLPAALALLLLVAASLGAGAIALHVLRLDDLDRLEHAVIAFVLGFGIVGWLIFFLALAGAIAPLHLGALAVVLAGGLLTFRKDRPVPGLRFERRSVLVFLLCVFAVYLAGDVIEGLAPPADADSLAYHFATPKLFLKEGRLFFIERAVDGAAPMLLHMTYLAALGLGGETCLTLWTMVTGWAAGAIVFVAARRLMSDEAALAAAVLFLTTPVVIYGAGTGQVEVRDAAFVVLAVMAAARTREDPRYAILAGLAAGFFAASKYTGLLLMASLGVVGLAADWRRAGRMVAFGIAGLAAGSQWYAWLWGQSGDPVFPMLAGFLQYQPGIEWTPEFGRYFSETFKAAETAIPRSLGSLLQYPLLATFLPPSVFDAGRAGLGPILALLIPFSLAGAARIGERWHTLGLLLGTAAAFYVLWFFFGPSQRVRHFVPIYPLALIALLALADRARDVVRSLAPALLAGCSAVMVAQGAMQVALTVNPAQYVIGKESRDQYLARNTAFHAVSIRLNERLTPADRLLVTERELLYFLDVPFFYASELQQMEIDVRSPVDPASFWRRMEEKRLSYALYPRSPGAKEGLAAAVERLIAQECLDEVEHYLISKRESRTVNLAQRQHDYSLLRRKDCQIFR